MGVKLVANTNVSDSTLQKHIRALSAARETLDEANGAYRALLKAAKGDGVNQKQLLAAMAARKHDDDQVKIDLRDYVRYLALCSMPVTQMDLFGGPPATAAAAAADEAFSDHPDDHDIWEATEAGKAAGKAGHFRRDNPHPAGTQLFVGWDQGYLDGQAAIAAGLATTKQKPASTRRRRSDGHTMLT